MSGVGNMDVVRVGLPVGTEGGGTQGKDTEGTGSDRREREGGDGCVGSRGQGLQGPRGTLQTRPDFCWGGVTG